MFDRLSRCDHSRSLPGNKQVYETEGEAITVPVTNETREILNITTIVVHDFVTNADGELFEDADGCYAQNGQDNTRVEQTLRQEFLLDEAEGMSTARSVTTNETSDPT